MSSCCCCWGKALGSAMLMVDEEGVRNAAHAEMCRCRMMKRTRKGCALRETSVLGGCRASLVGCGCGVTFGLMDWRMDGEEGLCG